MVLKFNPIQSENTEYGESTYKEINELIPVLDNSDNFDLRSYPKYVDIKKNYVPIEMFRKLSLQAFKKILEKVYNDDNIRLVSMVPSSSKHQTFFKINHEISKIVFRGVEVCCRLIYYYNNGNGENTKGEISCNLSRISNIKFKGELQDVIHGFLKRCYKQMKELVAEIKDDLPIKDHVMYFDMHNISKNTCKWPCEKIHEYTKNNCATAKNYFNTTKNEIVCYSKRQVIGQAFYPYVYKETEKDVENGQQLFSEEDYNEEEELAFMNYEEDFKCDNYFVFDKFLIDASKKMKIHPLNMPVLGIFKQSVSIDEANILSNIGQDVCSALMSFQLDKIGITNNAINLYLTNKGAKIPILCTTAKCSSEIPSAKDYLMKLCMSNESIQSRLIDEKKIKKECFNKKPLIKDFNQSEASDYEEGSCSDNNNKKNDDDDDDNNSDDDGSDIFLPSNKFNKRKNSNTSNSDDEDETYENFSKRKKNFIESNLDSE